MPKVQDAPETTTHQAAGGGGDGPPDGQVTSSLDLSWLAEKADGTRDENLALVKDASGRLQIREPAQPGEAPALQRGDELIVPVRTKGTCKREKVATITISTKGGGEAEIKDMDKGPDALFWTDSAVEKFLYPYYHSQRIWNEDMDRLRAKFSTDPTAIAVLHRAPSTSGTLSAGHVSAEHAIQVACVKPGTEMAPKVGWVALAAYLMEKSDQPR